ncbi:MAG: aldehyde ferredoxin oxidoreductase family protein [Chloroflexota bacterium]
MPGGYNGRVLHVDLSSGSIEVEQLGDEFYRQYLGGRAVITHYLLKLTAPGVDPLGPENVLVIAPGVVTGAAFSGQGRNGIGAKSPLTNALGSSEGGGFFGAELKRAGFDAIVVKGRAPKPTYLWVHDGQAELRDAAGIWGADVAVAEDLIRQDVGEPQARTCLIGPAGERLVRYACVVNDCNHFAGRGGMGAVMGSKNLKAVAARARAALPAHNPAGVRELVTWFNANKELVRGLHDVGTSGGTKGLNVSGGLPTFNFLEGSFAGHEQLTGEAMRDTILVDRGTCFACGVVCKRIVEVTEGPIQISRRYGGPEYETVAAFGCNCGIDDLVAIAKASERSAALGLDSISTGVAISFAMECFEKGLLTTAETGGVDLRFGNTAAMLAMVEAIAYREGLGDILAEGVVRTAERLGLAGEEAVMHVKGQEIPMHEPRIKHALALAYAISPTGADHQHAFHDNLFLKPDSPLIKRMQAFGDFAPVEVHGFAEEKMELFYHYVNWRHFNDCAVICNFLPYSPPQMAAVINALTGWDADAWELLRVGERAANLARIYNLREGFGAGDDVVPQRFHEEFRNGNSTTGKPVDPAALDGAKQWYYRRMGWDEAGVPTAERLAELGVAWASTALP